MIRRQHSDNKIFHKKLRKVGLFLRTFFRIKIKLKLFFLFDPMLGENSISISKFFAPRGRGVGGHHSSPPIFFHKKLWKVGLFLRTFFRIKIFAAVPKLLASQVFFKLFLLSECCQRVIGGCSTETVHKQNIL